MGRPRKAEARDTRREILNAALDLFGQDGFLGVSMRQIASAVGVRESALYHHFPSKDAILLAVIDEYGPGRARQVADVDLDKELQAGVHGWLRKLAHRIIGHWGTAQEQKFVRLIFSEGPRALGSALSPAVEIDGAVQMMAGMFSELMHRKLIRRVDPEVAAREFIAPLVLARLQHLMFNGAPGPQAATRVRKLVDQHVDFLVEALQK